MNYEKRRSRYFLPHGAACAGAASRERGRPSGTRASRPQTDQSGSATSRCGRDARAPRMSIANVRDRPPPLDQPDAGHALRPPARRSEAHASCPWERGRPARTGAEPPEMRMRAGRPRSQDAHVRVRGRSRTPRPRRSREACPPKTPPRTCLGASGTLGSRPHGGEARPPHPAACAERDARDSAARNRSSDRAGGRRSRPPRLPAP